MAGYRSQLAGVLIAVTWISGCDSHVQPVVRRAADTVYHNGNVITGVAGADGATAVAVANGRILAVGDDAEILAHATEVTEILDLRGDTMLPGLFDNHVHAGIGRSALMEWEGGLIAEVPAWVREARTIEDLQQALGQGGEQARAGCMDRRRAEP